MVETTRRPLTVGSPYKGLAPFTDKDAQYFFGRDRARRIISANLQSSRLTVLYGESGVGKSSLLRAGVVHHLRAQARRDLDELGTAGFVVVEYATWQGEPLPGLAAAMTASLEETFGHRPEIDLSADDRLEDWIKQISAALDVDLLFIFDQFEEYFVYHTADHPFIDQFSASAERQDLRANFLVSIRDDRLAELDRLRTWIRGDMLYNRLKVEHLDVAAARLAITEPIEEYNRHDVAPVSIEPALVEAVIGQVKRGQVAIGEVPVATTDDARIETPYLQLVMSRLWEVETGAGSTVLRRGTLDELGGADRIVREHLDTALTELSPDQQSTAADLFRYLVTPAGSKIALGVGDLADFTGHEPQRVTTVLRQLSEGGVRVLRTVPPPPGGTEARFEIFHDVLAPAITEWRARFDEQRNSVEARQELEERVRASRRRALVFGAVAVAAIVAATAIVLVIRSEQREAEVAQASAEQAQLETEYQLLVSEAHQATDPQDAMRSALAALELSRGPEAEEALRRAVSENRLAAIVSGHDDVVWSAAYSPDGSRVVTASRDGTASVADATDGTVLASLIGHEGDVLNAVFTPDGDRVVTSGIDGTARVWSSDGSLLQTLDHQGPEAAAPAEPDDEPAYVSLASTDVRGPEGGYAATGGFSADGSLLVTAFETSAWIWDLDTGELVRELTHDASVNSAAFSPDGRQVVTGAGDGVVRVWSVDGELVEAFGELYDNPWVMEATFDPTGTRILAGHSGGHVTLWEPGSPFSLMDLGWHTDDVAAVSFSFDGSRFLTAGGRTVRIFVTKTLFNDSLYSGSSWVNDAGFSPDGRTAVVAESDGTASFVSSTYDKPVLTLTGHGNVVWSAAFSPDGSRVVTAGEDGTARIWAGPDGLVITAEVESIQSATFDPLGDLVLTAGFDGKATVHDVLSGDVTLEMQGDVVTTGGNVYYPMSTADFDTAGERIVTAQDSGVVRLWDAVTGKDLGDCCYTGPVPWAATFLADDSIAVGYLDNSISLWEPNADGWENVHVFSDTQNLAASEDGSALATVDRDGITWVRDSTTREAVRSWETGVLNSIAISRDGGTVVTNGVDGSITVRDVSSGAVVMAVPDADARVVALGADDSLIVSGGGDGAASIWRLSDGAYLGGVVAHADSITTVEMSSDGLIATSSFDGTARVFSCEVCSASLDEVIEMAEDALEEPAG